MKTESRIKIYGSLCAVIVFASGCLTTKPTPVIEHKPSVSNYPVLGLRFASDEVVQPSLPQKPGTHWSRNWGWYTALAGILATDALTQGDVVGIFHGSSDDDHHINVSEIDGGPVVAARGESSIFIENAPSCDFNFVAEEGSEISCSALVPDDEE